MKREKALKLLSEVRDLQIVDCQGRNCGICDDIELSGAPGEALAVKALLVGPGAYSHRLPWLALMLLKPLIGTHLVRVPWEAVQNITSRIHLNESRRTLGLHRIEDKLEKHLRRIPTA